MSATEIINENRVQIDLSGVGHCWRAVGDDEIADIAEEIACWIIEDDPQPGDEYTASSGQHYRLPPE